MLFDAHLHSFNVGHADMENMYLAGIRSFVSAVIFARTTPVSPEVYKALWDLQLEDETARAKDYLIDAYAMIGVAMVSIPTDPLPLLRVLPEYLKRDRVLAVGEIGIDPNSPTCRDLGKQKEIFAAQVEIAKAAGTPVVVHVPNRPDYKVKHTEETMQIARDLGFDFNRLVIDHCSEANLTLVHAAGAHAAITVQSWRGMTPETAAELVEKHGPDRLWVDSDSSDLPSDPIAVARVAYCLLKRGLSEQVVDKVCRANAAAFYGLKP